MIAVIMGFTASVAVPGNFLKLQQKSQIKQHRINYTTFRMHKQPVCLGSCS